MIRGGGDLPTYPRRNGTPAPGIDMPTVRGMNGGRGVEEAETLRRSVVSEALVPVRSDGYGMRRLHLGSCALALHCAVGIGVALLARSSRLVVALFRGSCKTRSGPAC